jgi:hypothetical protein
MMIDGKKLGYAVALGIAMSVVPLCAVGQVNIERQSLRGTIPLTPPGYLEPQGSIEAPEPAPPQDSEALSLGQVFKIDKIEVAVEKGDARIRQLTIGDADTRRTIDAQAAISEVTAPYLEKGRAKGLGVEDIVELRDRLTLPDRGHAQDRDRRGKPRRYLSEVLAQAGTLQSAPVLCRAPHGHAA